MRLSLLWPERVQSRLVQPTLSTPRDYGYYRRTYRLLQQTRHRPINGPQRHNLRDFKRGIIKFLGFYHNFEAFYMIFLRVAK